MEALLYLALINQLGDKNFHNREIASKILNASRIYNIKYTTEASNYSNPEIARRAGTICYNFSVDCRKIADAIYYGCENIIIIGPNGIPIRIKNINPGELLPLPPDGK